MLSKQEKRKRKRKRQRERRRVREEINKVIANRVSIIQGCKNPEIWTSLSQVAVPKPFRLGSLWYCKYNNEFKKELYEKYGNFVWEIVDASDQQKEVWVEYGYENDAIFLENRTIPGLGCCCMSIDTFIKNYIPYTGSYDYYSEASVFAIE